MFSTPVTAIYLYHLFAAVLQDRCRRMIHSSIPVAAIYLYYLSVDISFMYHFTVPFVQDRCHRIGQTREVHIYRLISSNTIEENILRKSDQKRQLDWLAIQSGGFNTEMLAKLNLGEFLQVEFIHCPLCVDCFTVMCLFMGTLMIWENAAAGGDTAAGLSAEYTLTLR